MDDHLLHGEKQMLGRIPAIDDIYQGYVLQLVFEELEPLGLSKSALKEELKKSGHKHKLQNETE